MQRPASRRAGRGSASPYEPEQHEAGTHQPGPFQPEPPRPADRGRAEGLGGGPRSSYGESGAPYPPGGRYQPGGRSQAPPQGRSQPSQGRYRPGDRSQAPPQGRSQPPQGRYRPGDRSQPPPQGRSRVPQGRYQAGDRYQGEGPYQPGAGYQPQYEAPYEAQYEAAGPGPDRDDPSWPGDPGRGGRRRRRRRGRGRMRRLLRFRTVRVILALVAVLCVWVCFSLGQALTAPGGGSVASKVAEWARDHYLGPAVTFAEWLVYTPPKVGGKPNFSLAAPKANLKYKHVRTFKPIIPANLGSPAGKPLPGEGVWRLVETVKGEPAVFTTFLRSSSVYSSYVAGLASFDQRLVKFQLHPGAEDPGPGNWKSPPWIPPGSRTGLLATFNGGFKLDVANGGFYLNGVSKGSLVNGAASVVYYRNGTIKIGAWNSQVHMTPNVVGVRQNLKLLVQNGKIPATVNQNVIGAWGATLGGGYYVWRSGLGITKDGRIIYVYGPALNVEELASLLKRAGAVQAMQLDINPFWMSFEYYKAGSHPSDPTPVALLPTQQQTQYRYYSIYSRDFTAVYAR